MTFSYYEKYDLETLREFNPNESAHVWATYVTGRSPAFKPHFNLGSAKNALLTRRVVIGYRHNKDPYTLFSPEMYRLDRDNNPDFNRFVWSSVYGVQPGIIFKRGEGGWREWYVVEFGIQKENIVWPKKEYEGVLIDYSKYVKEEVVDAFKL